MLTCYNWVRMSLIKRKLLDISNFFSWLLIKLINRKEDSYKNIAIKIPEFFILK